VTWNECLRSSGLKGRDTFFSVEFGLQSELPRGMRAAAAVVLFLLLLTSSALSFPGHKKKDAQQYGEGLIVNVPLPVTEVAQAVEEVTQNTIIRGSKEYNKDEYISGAVEATSTPVFAAWKEGGTVFYKVRTGAIDPRNFKDGGDVGTLAVRYIVQPQGDKNTVLRIDALFVEDFRRTIHPSNGSVEGAEYKDIQDKLAAVELVKKETADALEAKRNRLAKQNFGIGSDTGVSSSNPSAVYPAENSIAHTSGGDSGNGNAVTPVPATQPEIPQGQIPQAPKYELSGESLQQHVAELRREVERLVKKPGAPLKSAPFHTASTVKSLEPGAEVLILISTTYWYGIETHDGDHGWIRRDQLEAVP
jgi:hypothetical protein